MTRTSQPARARAASASRARASVRRYISIQTLRRAAAIRSTIAPAPASGSTISATGPSLRAAPAGGPSPQAGSRASVNASSERPMTGTPAYRGARRSVAALITLVQRDGDHRAGADAEAGAAGAGRPLGDRLHRRRAVDLRADARAEYHEVAGRVQRAAGTRVAVDVHAEARRLVAPQRAGRHLQVVLAVVRRRAAGAEVDLRQVALLPGATAIALGDEDAVERIGAEHAVADLDVRAAAEACAGGVVPRHQAVDRVGRQRGARRLVDVEARGVGAEDDGAVAGRRLHGRAGDVHRPERADLDAVLRVRGEQRRRPARHVDVHDA